MMQSGSSYFSAALFLAAGLYQFSPLKERCLSLCRSPDGFILSEWRDGALAQWSWACATACSAWAAARALMALLFAVAVMDLRWVVGLTILVTAEKLLAAAQNSGALASALACSPPVRRFAVAALRASFA